MTFIASRSQLARELENTPVRKRESTGKLAFLVASGILLSRLMGLVRLRVFSHYFGLRSDSADAFNAAFRIPNFLQNLFGEGVLSASFIPVYARLLAEGDEEEAGRVAGGVAATLALLVSVLCLTGVFATPWLIDLIAPGFSGAKRELTISLVRILFPGAGLLVFSAWCLGILNSHRKLFLSYAAPVMWNSAMIATLLIFGGRNSGGRGSLSQLAMTLAWGSVIGSALQFGIQLPVVLRLARHLRLRLDFNSEHVRIVIRNFVPVFISRGVVQISAYVDALLASLLPTGAVTGLINAQLIYVLPVSLFGMSVSAAELPVMSSATGSMEEIQAALRDRLDSGLRHIAFFIVPSAAAFLAFGDMIAGALLQTGRFTHRDADYVWGILAGSAVGLLASTLGRLYSSAYYALRDTRTPLRFAVLRVALTTVLGYICAKLVPGWIGIDPRWGVAGLTASAGVAGWVEFTLLRRGMHQRLGPGPPVSGFIAKLWLAALLAVAVGSVGRLTPFAAHPIYGAIATLGPFGVVYLGIGATFAPEARRLVTRLLRH
ncbi:MAG TPA: murein biosynthesis integral membrane protein MurJ [Bryobacteraceae bacterium]|nr:murein biosynthesis integral membrane protein MurJ [Bryobacteraceae bacterium]